MDTKNITNSLLSKGIQTPEIIIKGNIMTWSNTMIQLSNISTISTIQEIPPFPFMSLGIALVGFVLAFVPSLFVLGILLMLLGGLSILFYVLESFSNHKYLLSIIMNSGMKYNFVVYKQDFLHEILSTLEDIIISGGIRQGSISINILNSRIDNFEALNDTTIR